MAEVRMTMEEYLNLINGLSSDASMMSGEMSPAGEAEPKKKRKSAYQKRYERNFRKIEKNYKLKSGKWKKNGFKMAVKMAHKMSKK